MRVLCLVIIDVTHAAVADYNCAPIENFVYVVTCWKCVSKSLRKLRAMFVLTFLLQWHAF